MELNQDLQTDSAENLNSSRIHNKSSLKSCHRRRVKTQHIGSFEIQKNASMVKPSGIKQLNEQLHNNFEVHCRPKTANHSSVYKRTNQRENIKPSHCILQDYQNASIATPNMEYFNTEESKNYNRKRNFRRKLSQSKKFERFNEIETPATANHCSIANNSYELVKRSEVIK